MPRTTRRARTELNNLPEQKPPTQPDTNAAVDEDQLPARVIVELPDGEILLGEDSGRLRSEQPVEPQPEAPRTGAQPGSEQWLDLRRLLYATGLEAVVLTRKRATSIILGMCPCTQHHCIDIHAICHAVPPVL